MVAGQGEAMTAFLIRDHEYEPVIYLIGMVRINSEHLEPDCQSRIGVAEAESNFEARFTTVRKQEGYGCTSLVSRPHLIPTSDLLLFLIPTSTSNV